MPAPSNYIELAQYESS